MTALPLRLVDRLTISAELWSAANDGSLAKLGRLVMNDSSYFNRTESPQGTTTGTLERFARFLGGAENWPDGEVPPEVREFVHAVGVTPEPGAASPGIEAADSPRSAAA